jgi:hypothetical protein
VHDIAREEQVLAAYLYTLLRLPSLAPDITTAIINGRKPLTAQTLMRLTPRLLAGWAEQRKLLGFPENKPSVLLTAACNCFDGAGDVDCSAREKSKPRNGAGAVFVTAGAEIARETVSAADRIEREAKKSREFPTK